MGFSRWIRDTARRVYSRGRKIVSKAYHITRKVVHYAAPIVSSIASQFGTKGKAIAAAVSSADVAMQNIGDPKTQQKVIDHLKAVAIQKAQPYAKKGLDMAQRLTQSRAGKIAQSLAATKEGGSIVSKVIAKNPQARHVLEQIKAHISGAAHQERTDQHVQDTRGELMANMFRHNAPATTRVMKKHENAHNPATMSFGQGGAGQRHTPVMAGGRSQAAQLGKITDNKNSFLGGRVA